ncbi:urease accessory protein UreF [soil metagenome]
MRMPVMTESLSALLQLASPTLPVGAFSYSQGFEHAIDSGEITDASSARGWIEDCIALVMPRFELPLFMALHSACARNDVDTVVRLDERFLASRDTRELRAETIQMGYSLHRLLVDLEFRHAVIDEDGARSWPAMFACACVLMKVDLRAGATAYVYAFAENQVLVALKSIPLGQVAGQRLLLGLHAVIATGVDAALANAHAFDIDTLASSAPRLSWHSARHETQYSRLFRS